MKKVLAFGASNSKSSINKRLAHYAAQKLENVEIVLIDLNDFQLPLFSPDLLKEQGMHAEAIRFDNLLAAVDGIIMSMAEYNGAYTTAFKNILDWISRIDMKTIWKSKPLLLLGTSPGKRGAAGVLMITKEMLPHFGGNLVADFSLPLFHENFQDNEIINPQKAAELASALKLFQAAI